MHERQGDRRRRRRRPAEDDLRHQLGGRAGRERDRRSSPTSARPSSPAIQAGDGRPASRSCRGAPIRAASTARTSSATSTGTTGYAGTMWANWMVKALHGKGNVIYTGGPAGNPVGADQLATIVKVFAKYPGMNLLTGNDELAGHELGSGDGAEGHGGAARQVPEDRRHHLELRHRRARERSGVPGGRAQARPDRDARRERALLPLQVREDAPSSRSRRSRPATGSAGSRPARRSPRPRGYRTTSRASINLPFFEDTLTASRPRCSATRRLPAGLLPLEQHLARRPIAKYGKP